MVGATINAKYRDSFSKLIFDPFVSKARSEAQDCDLQFVTLISRNWARDRRPSTTFRCLLFENNMKRVQPVKISMGNLCSLNWIWIFQSEIFIHLSHYIIQFIMVYSWIMREIYYFFTYCCCIRICSKAFQFRRWNKSKDGINQVNYYALHWYEYTIPERRIFYRCVWSIRTT